ncbi:Glucan endo-1,3-alpha-glucosidase agn1, partial [Termitomyces sp. T112]
KHSTHYDYKNFLHKSDDWLYLTRWNQLMAMRDQLTFVEVISWNDFGESHYMGPIHGLQPSGTTWVNNFPHTAWQELSAYYIHAFKTGSYPTITEDIVYYWARPHPASARASKDSLEKPQGWDWVSDTLWAAVFLTAPGTVTLTSGSSSQTFKNVPAGVSRLSIPLTPGMISVKVERGGKTVASERARGYNYVSTPETYNFNAWVGAAKGTVQPSSTPTSMGTSTTTVTRTTTSLSMTTSKSVHATTTSTVTTTSTTSQATHTPPTSKWSSLGCFVDTSYPRILPVFGASSSSMTPQTCTSMCASHGYSYAATEYGVECWCGSGIDLSTSVSKGQCNMPCAGDKTRTCGAAWRAEVYFRSGS